MSGPIPTGIGSSADRCSLRTSPISGSFSWCPGVSIRRAASLAASIGLPSTTFSSWSLSRRQTCLGRPHFLTRWIISIGSSRLACRIHRSAILMWQIRDVCLNFEAIGQSGGSFFSSSIAISLVSFSGLFSATVWGDCVSRALRSIGSEWNMQARDEPVEEPKGE